MQLRSLSQTITDPAEWDGSLFGTQLELVKLTGDEFYSSQTFTEFLGIQILQLTINQPITVRSRPLTLRYFGTLFDRSHAGHYAGAPIKEGEMLILPPSFEFDACVNDSGFRCISVFAAPKQLRSYYRSLLGREIDDIDSITVARPDLSKLQWLVSWPDVVASVYLDSLTEHQRVSVQETLRDETLTMLVHALQRSGCEDKPEPDSRLMKSRNLVRKVEDYAASRQGSSLRMVDLCRITDVSERTLQYAFHACLGISPTSYLKKHRLHQCRRELNRADPSKTTVSSIACQFGFLHFGDFSQAYKTQFGESPSDTLKRI